jgi:hypothetical protein
MKTIHTKKQFREDLQYARKVIAQIENSIRNNDWNDVEQAAMELSGLFGTIEGDAKDNAEGIENFYCKNSVQIEEIRAQQEAEREKTRQKDLAKWQKAGEQVAREFEQFLPIKITVVTEGLETK